MKKIFAILTLACPLFAQAETVRYKETPTSYIVLTGRECPGDFDARVAFILNRKTQRVTKVGCWVPMQGRDVALWGSKGDEGNTVIEPSDLYQATFDDR